MRADARVVHEQRDARVFPKLRFDRRKRRRIGQIGADDLDAPARFVRDALGEISEPVVAAGDEDQVVAALGEPLGVDRADARRCP
jgi:hypothetical protein